MCHSVCVCVCVRARERQRWNRVSIHQLSKQAILRPLQTSTTVSQKPVQPSAVIEKTKSFFTLKRSSLLDRPPKLLQFLCTKICLTWKSVFLFVDLSVGHLWGPDKRDRIKALLLRPRRYCGRDMLIRKLQKFTIQNVSLNATIEKIRRMDVSSSTAALLLWRPQLPAKRLPKHRRSSRLYPEIEALLYDAPGI